MSNILIIIKSAELKAYITKFLKLHFESAVAFLSLTLVFVMEYKYQNEQKKLAAKDN